MSIGTPKISITNFSGISDNGVYFLQGFVPNTYNGATVLSTAYSTTFLANGGTSGWSGMSEGHPLAYTVLDYGGIHRVIFDCGSKLFSYNPYGVDGRIHTFVATGSGTDYFATGSYPGFITTKKQNLLYTTTNHIGFGITGKCTSASSTTKIVDADGRNFSTLGISTSAPRNKVFNITTKTEFTVTSISTTTSTNDTLNFTAGTNNSLNDIFVAFSDNKFKFGTSDNNSDQHFIGQTGPNGWSRKGVAFNSAYYFLNGNYVSKITDDDTAWTSDVLDEAHKQLPTALQAMGLATNSDKMAVIAAGQKGGFLLLWDGFASGWINSIALSGTPTSIKPYTTGFAFFMDGTVYFTDGYSISKLFMLPDTRGTIVQIQNSSMEVILDEIFIIGGYSTAYGGRSIKSVWAWNPEKGLTSVPVRTNYGITNTFTGGTIFAAPANTSGGWGQQVAQLEIYCGFTEDGISNAYNINKLYKYDSPHNLAQFYVKLPSKQKLSLIELNIATSFNHSAEGAYNNDNITVTVSYGQGERRLYGYGQTNTGSTSSLIKSTTGINQQAFTGQKIEMVGGELTGQFSYVQEVSGQGTSGEEFTISPALTGTPDTYSDYVKHDLYSAGAKTFTINTIPKDLIFNIPSFYSDKLWLEVMITCASGVNLEIHGINIY